MGTPGLQPRVETRRLQDAGRVEPEETVGLAVELELGELIAEERDRAPPLGIDVGNEGDARGVRGGLAEAEPVGVVEADARRLAGESPAGGEGSREPPEPTFERNLRTDQLDETRGIGEGRRGVVRRRRPRKSWRRLNA